MAVMKTSAKSRDVTVLLAEDEAMIRELIATFLANLGFSVHEAENGKVALETATKLGPTSISLLVSDLVMPQMGGLELASELRKSAPDIRVLFISGYTDDVVILDDHARSRTSFLRKPFSFELLRQRIEALLAEG